MLRIVSLGGALVVAWLLLSGHYTPLILAFGLFSVIAVVAIAVRMDVVDHESVPIHMTGRFLSYWIWLAREIVKANIDVAKRVWSPALPISPTLLWLKTSQPGELGQVIYANSITLTPGTVSVSLQEDRILVHAIAREVGDDLAAGEMDQRVTRLEASGIPAPAQGGQGA
ncbi:MAG: Na+/H+ antiporter subunit E [Rhodospirillales bacterium]|nr:MAG: Na+/H+ antiporter subunit E [Rhodospirillales bacterium]